MKLPELKYEDISEAIAYNPQTGEFTWKLDVSKNVKKGSVAGSFKNCRHRTTGQIKSYLYIRYKDREMVGSRVAWMLQTQSWPDQSIVFADGDTTNLRWENLKLSLFKSGSTIVDGRRNYKMSKEATRHYGLKRHYGITLTEYSEMHKSQNGKCAICGNPETTMLHGKIRDLSVDHCHKSGKIRQLLCNACNHILGESKENKQTLLAAVAYLERHEADNLGTPVTQTGLADAAQTV